jgi:hypothetical protein
MDQLDTDTFSSTFSVMSDSFIFLVNMIPSVAGFRGQPFMGFSVGTRWGISFPKPPSPDLLFASLFLFHVAPLLGSWWFRESGFPPWFVVFQFLPLSAALRLPELDERHHLATEEHLHEQTADKKPF